MGLAFTQYQAISKSMLPAHLEKDPKLWSLRLTAHFCRGYMIWATASHKFTENDVYHLKCKTLWWRCLSKPHCRSSDGFPLSHSLPLKGPISPPLHDLAGNYFNNRSHSRNSGIKSDPRVPREKGSRIDRRNLQGELPGLGEGLPSKHKALGSTSSSEKKEST